MLPFLLAMAHANPIVNGQLESDYPSTVALGADFGSYTFSACTGNLITPRVILTAAHCGGDIPLELVLSSGSAFFGASIWEAEHIIGFSDLVIHPDYDELSGSWNDLGAYDFAVLVLEEDAPVEPTWFRREEMTDADLGTEVTSVGFGITSSSSNDSGTKRSAGLSVDELEEMFIIAYNSENPDNANICSGDSGGPMFYHDAETGRHIQWAVHSWGDQNCTTMSGSTRVDLVSEWILDQIEDVHGTRDVCEASGWYDDGVCDDLCDEFDPDCLPSAEGTVAEVDEEAKEKKGCMTAPSSGLFLWLPAMLLGLLRRRS